MKALSICQPWATCIARKGKNVENRSWKTKKRGFFAVHASLSKDLERFAGCAEDYRIRLDPESVPYGAIVAFAELVDVVSEESLTKGTRKWFQGEYGLVLRNVIPLKTPIRAKGSLSFWKLKGPSLAKCLQQLTSKQRKLVTSRALE